MALPRTPGVTDPPMALAASASVTTEQELKLALAAAAVVVVADAVVGAPVVGDAVVGDAVDVVEGDEPHAAKRRVTGTAMAIPATPGRRGVSSLIRFPWSDGRPRVRLERTGSGPRRLTCRSTRGPSTGRLCRAGVTDKTSIVAGTCVCSPLTTRAAGHRRSV